MKMKHKNQGHGNIIQNYQGNMLEYMRCIQIIYYAVIKKLYIMQDWTHLCEDIGMLGH